MNTINNELLTADLRVFRGGNKARLVARCYVAVWSASSDKQNLQSYEEFRSLHTKWTFNKLHEVYDHMLPADHRAKY